MRHFGDAGRDRIEGRERRHDLACGENLDLEPAAAHLRDAQGEPASRNAGPREIAWPGGHHAPTARRLGTRDRRGRQRRGADAGEHAAPAQGRSAPVHDAAFCLRIRSAPSTM